MLISSRGSDIDSMQDISINASGLYHSWNAFKRDVDLNLGHYVSVNLFMQTKPPKPLPWTKSDVKQTVLRIKKVESAFAIKPIR